MGLPGGVSPEEAVPELRNSLRQMPTASSCLRTSRCCRSSSHSCIQTSKPFWRRVAAQSRKNTGSRLREETEVRVHSQGPCELTFRPGNRLVSVVAQLRAIGVSHARGRVGDGAAAQDALGVVLVTLGARNRAQAGRKGQQQRKHSHAAASHEPLTATLSSD